MNMHDYSGSETLL